MFCSFLWKSNRKPLGCTQRNAGGEKKEKKKAPKEDMATGPEGKDVVDLLCPHLFDVVLSAEPVDEPTLLAHAWNDQQCSPNLYLKPGDPLTIKRRPVIQSTDCVLGKAGHSSGFHVYEMEWPVGARGSHAMVGVARDTCALQYKGYTYGVGIGPDSWAWSINNNECLHQTYRQNKWMYPPHKYDYVVPSRFYLILDSDAGELSFATDDEFLGVAFTGITGEVFPTIATVWGHCEIRMRYLGGIDAAPPSLLSMCRRVIRSHLGPRRVHAVRHLNLPHLLKMYLE